MSKLFLGVFVFAVVFMAAFASATECPWDVNLDETVDNLDRIFVSDHFGCDISNEECAKSDIDKNGIVNAGDRGYISANMGMTCPIVEAVSNNRPREETVPTLQVQCRADVDANGIVNLVDSEFVSMRIAEEYVVGTGNSQYDAADVDANGFINPGDLGFISAELGRVCDVETEETDGGRSAGNIEVVELPANEQQEKPAPVVERTNEVRTSSDTGRNSRVEFVQKEKVSEVAVKETSESIKLESKTKAQKSAFSKLALSFKNFFKRN